MSLKVLRMGKAADFGKTNSFPSEVLSHFKPSQVLSHFKPSDRLAGLNQAEIEDYLKQLKKQAH